MDKRQNKSWMFIRDRRLPEYLKGVDEFVNMAALVADEEDNIKCPCCKCNNRLTKSREEVKGHLLRWGMVESYIKWEFHGECSSDDESTSDERNDDGEVYSMLHDMYRCDNADDMNSVFDETTSNHEYEEPNEEARRFYRLLKDAEQKLYPSCDKFTKLSCVVQLFQMKCLNGWSNASFDSLLKLLKDILPEGNVLPDSFYEAKKIVKDLGLHYVKIDACVKDCILYRNEYAKLDKCPRCGENRWKTSDKNYSREDGPNNSKRQRKQIPQKILRYFPLKARLQRLFMSSKTVELMRWHNDKRVKDGVLRHPADSMAWKHFDRQHPFFASDSRNVRLGLAADGFNPFGNMSTAYSVWPIILIPYNLPPWLCMKQAFSILSMIIPGPKGPGNNIDVYLAPLIEELNDLWSVGIYTYDASMKQNFKLHAALLWTINDFPAYAMLSGWSTKGKLACPCCHSSTHSHRLKHGRKYCYMGHRRFLPFESLWRKNKTNFDNTVESRPAPEPLSGDDVLAQFETFADVVLGETTRKRKRDCDVHHNWKKKSIFFSLPYWRTLLLRHNLDVMHIEKNISDSVLGTLLDIKGKTKDSLNSRLDLKLMGIKPTLHPIKNGDKYVLPPATFTLSSEEKFRLCQRIKDVKFPDAYASNIARCVNVKECKIMGLKSHDHHVLFERILPLVIKDLLVKDASDPLVQLSLFFSSLCSTELKVEDLEKLQNSIVVTLCKLEQTFPPSFFDIMVHLPIHLVNEAKIGGPVQYRWMYFVERLLRTEKHFVRNKARPEGSIAEGYISEEAMTLCERYFNDMDTKLSRPNRNSYSCLDNAHACLSVFEKNGRSLGGEEWISLELHELQQANFYILENCEEVRPWIEEHKEVLKRENNGNIERRHKEEFIARFEKKLIMTIECGVSNGSASQGTSSKSRTQGTVTVHQHALQNVKTWKDIEEIVKERIVTNVLDSFRLPNTEEIKRAILNEARDLYRYRRSRLHAHYMKFATKEQCLQNKPTDLSKEEWEFLVDHFSSPSFMKISDRNKENRAKQLINHCCGRRSFQRVSYEKRDPQTGKEPNFQELWKITHIKKNGAWVDNKSEQVNEQVEQVVHEKLQGIEEEIDTNPIINAAFVSVVGHRSGHCRGRGKGPRPTTSRSVEAIQEQLAAQQRETNEVFTTLTEVQAQLAEERRKREEMEARINEREIEMQERMGNQFEKAIRAVLSQVGLSHININLDFLNSGS